MINAFVVKKYTALLMSSMISSILLFTGTIFYGILGGVGFLLAGFLITLPIGVILLKNPFSSMIEGRGILAFDINSTGVITPFIVAVNNPYVRGKVRGKVVEDIFNRSTVQNLATPEIASKPVEIGEDGSITIKLSNEEYNKGRFGLFHYPVIIYNGNVGSIVTKDFLSESEKTTFAEHGIIALNRRVEELSASVKNFGRHIVDLTRPETGGILDNKWTWIIIAILFVVLAILFGPAILNAAKGAAGGVTSSLPTATITPRG